MNIPLEEIKEELQASVNEWFNERPQRPIAQFMLDTMSRYIENLRHEPEYFYIMILCDPASEETRDGYIELQRCTEADLYKALTEFDIVGEVNGKPIYKFNPNK